MIMKKLISIQLITQLFRFGIVGSLATLLNSVVFVTLVNSLKFQPLLGNLLAFLAAFCISYFGHSWWTFKNNRHSNEKLIKFLMTSLVGLGINSVFVCILMHRLHQSAYVATLPMIFVTPLLIFFINRSWVFKRHLQLVG